MKLCEFCMQIGSHRAYATTLRNELRKNDVGLRKNLTKATIFLYGYCPGSTELCRVDCQSDDLKFLSLCFFVFDSIFLRLWKCSVTLGIAISFKPNCHRFPVELEIYYARFSESFVLFLSTISQKTVSLLKEEFVVINIPLARSCTVFTEWVPGRVTLE